MFAFIPDARRVLLIGIACTACGCRYDGSFMQMNSDAPFPFFGLQLSVQNSVNGSNIVAPVSGSDIPLSESAADTAVAQYPDHELHDDVESLTAGNAVSTRDGLPPGLVPTSASSEDRSRVRYSFPPQRSGTELSANEVTLRVNSF